jgi:hypothetical protein
VFVLSLPQRRKSVEPLYDQLAAPNERLYIGGWPEQPGWLPPVQPAILDVTCELPRTYTDSEYLMLPTWDTQGARLRSCVLGFRFISWICLWCSSCATGSRRLRQRLASS